MAGRRASERDVVKPFTEEEIQRRTGPDGERRRERRAQARRARSSASFDALAIGAPLSAAFIGMLLADGYALAEPGADAGDGIAAARGGTHGISLEGPRADRAGGERAAGGEAAGIGADSADAGEGAFTPSPSIGDADGMAGDATAAAGVEVPDEASAGIGAKAAVSAGPEFSLTFVGFGGMLGSELSGEDGAGSGESHTIGKFVVGGDGDDVIYGTEHNDHLYGGAGNDRIYGLGGDDLLDGGIGDDYLDGGAGDDRLFGGPGQDELHGREGDDDLDGGAGNDRLFGNEGDDSLGGGAGDDYLDGGLGTDGIRGSIQGGAGNDAFVIDNIHEAALENQRSADGGGVDTLQVGDGFATSLQDAFGADEAAFVLHDRVDEALPDGTASYRQQVDPDIENVVLTGSADHDVVGSGASNSLTGNDGDNALFGMSGDDALSGGAGQDRLDGGDGIDRLHGNDGDDILAGQAGNDDLYGGGGDDLLAGGLGEDQMYGQAGNDSFHLGLNDSAGDTIFDHEGVNGIVIEDGEGHLVETGVVGDDLYIVIDKNPIGPVVKDWVGNEGALGGIDAGGGSVAVSDLMAENAGNGPALTDPGPEETAPTQAWAGDDLLGDFLTMPSLTGSGGLDSLSGTSGSDWLSGLDGDDHLQGSAGRDVLEGGAGSDMLEGGLGDDQYLFGSDDGGLDTIRDTQGSNTVELDGFTGAGLEGRVVGQDLYVLADYAPLFIVQDFVGNESAFAGIQNGDRFIATEDLLA